jgi:hypothetical protein
MMEEGRKKSYDFHAELAKQVLTLCTGMFTLIVAAANAATIQLKISQVIFTGLVLLFLSIIFGLLHLGALASAAELESKISDTAQVLWTARIQQLLFVAAIGAFLIAFF